MKKYLYILLIIPVLSLAQVGINTTTPAAQLEIKSSNQATPANTDGILIPKIDAFPVVNPTAAQKGMLVYLTTTSGANQPGFYYWNNPGWVPIISGSAGGTLDQSYDFGGAGVGRTITADAGAVTINGTDGLVSIGTSGSGAVAPTGAGVRMVWNPNKSAFRAGNVTGSQWNDANIGLNSVAFGLSTTASGSQSVALGNLSVASGNRSFAAGDATIASGIASTAFGNSSSAIGDQSIASGQGTIANGQASTSLGRNTIASGNSSLVSGFDSRAQSFGETVVGVGATNYTPSINGTTQWRAANSSDRLFVVGNAIDSNNNFLVDLSERSDAFVILKNGNTGIGSSTPSDKLHVVGNIRMVDGNQAAGKVLVSDANGTATWQTPAAAGTTLDGAYDFGGAGAGRTITADTGAVTIAGTDGLVSTGTELVGALPPSGAGTRMVWNPRKAAFRAGTVSGTNWDNASIGFYSTAFGFDNTANGSNSTAFGGGTIASGVSSVAFGGSTTASGDYSASFGISTTASGARSATFGFGNFASGINSFAIGINNTASGLLSTVSGSNNTASGLTSTVSGMNNTAPSIGETAVGIGATTYTPSVSGDTQFRATNSTDRLFVVGNAIDANSNNIVDTAERSDALIILKNGLTRLASTTNAMITAADGKAVVTKEYLAANTSGTLDQAYDFGGAGAGRAITADSGAVTIDGTDGLVSTGTLGSGAVVPSGAGTRMVWNPNKGAFRAGSVDGTQWNDANVGQNSVAFGSNTVASGLISTALGEFCTATGFVSTAIGRQARATGLYSIAIGNNSDAFGPYSMALGDSSFAGGNGSLAWGFLSQANGNNSVAIGYNTLAGGTKSIAFGEQTTADGFNSTVFGRSNTASSFSETVLGIGATTYAPSVNGTSQFRAANATDRLLVVGNAIDANNNNTVDLTERRDAFVILKNGNTGIGSSTPQDKLHVVGNIRMVDGNQAVGKVLTSDANGTATWTTAGTIASGTLDQAYDFGGAGAGRTITADTGAVTIAGTDGLVSTGTILTGALAPSGAGVRMVWNPRLAAFRAGTVSDASWDSTNIGGGSVAFGDSTTASGDWSFAHGSGSKAVNFYTTAFGNGSTASGGAATAFGHSSLASGINATAFGSGTTASGNNATAFGIGTTASGNSATAFGIDSTASSILSTAFGYNNIAQSFGETVLGIGSNGYTPSLNGATQFRAANATDRLLVVGNAIDFNGNGIVDIAEQSNALIILKNGLTRLPSTTNAMITAADGKALVTKEYLASNAWDLTGNTGTSAATNYLGTNDDIDLILKRFNTRAGRIGTNNTSLGVNALNTAVTGASNTAIGVDALKSATTGTNNTAVGQNALGNINGGSFNTAIGAEATTSSTIFTNATAIGSRALAGNSNVLVLGSINGVNGATNSVNVGIGTTIPQTKLEIVDGNKVTSNTGEGNLHVVSNNPQNTDIGGSISLGGFGSSTTNTSVFATVEGRKSNAGALSDSGYLIFKTNNVGALTERMRITNTGDIGIGTAVPGGQFELSLNEGRKPGTNTWTIVSDQRLKTINGSYTKGLNEILQLNPIRFNYKNNGERTFEKEVLDTEFAGFIAQEVQPLFPDAVGTDKDGFLNFNIHPILIASVNALKELNEKNTSLREENEVLKQAVEEMRQQIELIKSEIEKLKQ